MSRMGDALLDVNLREMNAFHQAQKGSATLAGSSVADARRLRTLRLDAHGRIMAFSEKSSGHANGTCARPMWKSNGGVSVFEKQLLRSIPSRKQVSLEKEVFRLLLRKMYSLGFATDCYFLDIGVPDDFRRAQSELPERFRINDSR